MHGHSRVHGAAPVLRRKAMVTASKGTVRSIRSRPACTCCCGKVSRAATGSVMGRRRASWMGTWVWMTVSMRVRKGSVMRTWAIVVNAIGRSLRTGMTMSTGTSAFTGTRPRGWLSPGLRETLETPDLLKAAGLDYVCDWVVDDLPSYMTTKHGPLVAMPYNLDVNDSIVYAIERHATGELLSRVRHTLACFERETTENPRVFAIGLHPHLIGVPHRIHELREMLDLLRGSSRVAFVNGSTICEWFTALQTPEQ